LFTPPATDEQTRMTQKMMNYMTIFIGVMFFKVPSGLCVYFITSSLWGIAERKLLPKVQKPGEEQPAAAPKSTQKPGPNGASRKTREKKKQPRKR
jgi:YidC/Oxa1 family membrane protein insertase